MNLDLKLIGGLVLMLIGGTLFSGEKSLGLHNPPIGVLLIGAGFLLALYSYIDGSAEDNSGPRRRVNDNFM